MANGQQGMGGLFSAPSVDQARQSRRERLFSQFAAGARSGGPGATFGAGLGSFLSGLFGEQPGVDRASRMASARNAINQRFGGVQNIAQSDEAVREAQQILADRGLQREAQQLPFEVQQYRMNEAKMRPEAQERAVAIRGGTPQARAAAQRFGVNIPEGETYELKIAGGRVTDVNRLGSGQTINVGGEPSAYMKARTGALEKEFERLQEASATARESRQIVSGLNDLVVRGDVKTGALQPAITGLQNIAQSAGLSLQDVADEAGVELGSLSQKEEFDRLSRQLTINQFAKFKGNLNQKEVDIAQGSVSQLGRSKEGNIEALSSMQASATLAERRANQLLSAQNQKEYNRIKDQIEEAGTEEFKALKEEYESRLRQQSGLQEGSQDNPYEPTTQQEYNEIPSGAFFVDDEGLKRKP